MPNKNKQLGTSQEARVVKRAREKGLKADKQPGSGVYKGYPADVTIETGLGECKVRAVSANKTITFSLDWLRKVVLEAKENGNEWGAVFFHPKGVSDQYVFLELDAFLELVKKSQQVR